MSSSSPSPYWPLLRDNVDFRRLWFGQVVSSLGDWLNLIALYRLVRTLTGSPMALGWIFVCKMLPWALASPVAGLLVDRFDRRTVMIVSDLSRAVAVAAFLLVDRPEEVPLLLALISLQVVLGSVFEPARTAVLPDLVRKEELVAANTLGSATWSVILALGAALGGLATEALGPRAVFVLDALTFLLSAAFIAGVRIPKVARVEDPGPLLSTAVGQVVEGWRLMTRRAEIGRIALAKAAWSLGGGGLVYALTLLGEARMPHAPALGVGLLFSLRGLGTGIGPVLARHYLPDRSAWPRVLGLCILGSGLFYLMVPVSTTFWLTCLLVLIAQSASGANWVLATVLLQERTAERFRGRVFATEWLLIMVADTASTLGAAGLLQAGLLDLGGVFGLFALVQVGAGVVWLLAVVPAEATYNPDHPW